MKLSLCWDGVWYNYGNLNNKPMELVCKDFRKKNAVYNALVCGAFGIQDSVSDSMYGLGYQEGNGQFFAYAPIGRAYPDKPIIQSDDVVYYVIQDKDVGVFAVDCEFEINGGKRNIISWNSDVLQPKSEETRVRLINAIKSVNSCLVNYQLKWEKSLVLYSKKSGEKVSFSSIKEDDVRQLLVFISDVIGRGTFRPIVFMNLLGWSKDVYLAFVGFVEGCFGKNVPIILENVEPLLIVCDRVVL